MHRICLIGLLAAVLLAGCYPTTHITGSWKNPGLSHNYHKIFIAALTENTVARSTLEKEMASALAKRGMEPVISMDEFPPGFAGDSVSRAALMERVKARAAEAILTIAVQKKETESRYVSGSYAPMTRWDYYGSFWGYYNHWAPYGYSPAYYQEQDVYYLETNLYDSKEGLLIWSAQSRTVAHDGLAGLAREFALTVVDKMRADGVLR